MLFAYIGTDTGVVRAAYTHAQGERGIPHIRFTPDTYVHEQVLQEITHTELFGEEKEILLDGMLSDVRTKESVLEIMPILATSPKHIFLVDGAVDALTRKKLEKYAHTVVQHDKSKTPKKGGDFSLADAFAKKNRAKAWVAYHKALLSGEEPEALHGMLFWKTKQLCTRAGDRSPEEVRALLIELSEMPGSVRKKNSDLKEALELFLLER